MLKNELIIIRVHHEKDRVQLVVANRLVLNIPWQQGIEVAKSLHAHAKMAEEYADAERIIHEEAALMRSGAPFSLTNDPVKQKIAGNEAAWGWPRRYIMNRIRQRGRVFAPTVRKVNK